MFVLLALFHYRMLPDHVESEVSYPADFEVDYVRVFRKRPAPGPAAPPRPCAGARK